MITADATTLMRHATMTARDYMSIAVEHIDQRFGKGYAKDHPELIGAYMQTAAMDMGAAIIAKEVGEALNTLADGINSLGESLRTDHPLQGETLEGITAALSEIAEAIGKHGESSPSAS